MGKKKILIVDNEPGFIEIVKMRLESHDFDVITAGGGEDALAILKNEKPDAILLDIMMPGMDGLKVLETIRAKDMNLPVFMITGFSTGKRFEKAKDLKASGFLIKSGDLDKEITSIVSSMNIAGKFKGKRE